MNSGKPEGLDAVVQGSSIKRGRLKVETISIAGPGFLSGFLTAKDVESISCEEAGWTVTHLDPVPAPVKDLRVSVLAKSYSRLSEDVIEALHREEMLRHMGPVRGDVLPSVGEQVLIHLARQDQWVRHTVVGYYVWPGLDEPTAFRVNVRVRDSQGYLNARSLEEVRKLDGSWYVPGGPQRNADAPILA